MPINEERGWLGMFGSLDCMNWVWKIALVLGMGSSKTKRDWWVLFLRRLLTNDCGYGMHFLIYPVAIMTQTCWIGLPWLNGVLKFSKLVSKLWNNPCCQWDMEVINDIMLACCIKHNMVIDESSSSIVWGLRCPLWISMLMLDLFAHSLIALASMLSTPLHAHNRQCNLHRHCLLHQRANGATDYDPHLAWLLL